VRVAPCEVDGLLAVIVYIDLVGIDEEAEARRTLLDSVQRSVRGRGKPETRPAFPAARAVATRPSFPGTEPAATTRDASALTVLHLSETRFAADAGEESLADLAADVERLAAEAGARPDLLIVTGDLAEAARPSELSLARAFVAGLGERLGIGRDRLIVVPGDHDVSQSASQAYF